jgi:nitrate reductase NapE component
MAGLSFPQFRSLPNRKESELEVGNLLTILVVAFTSVAVVGLGVLSAYGLVVFILEAVSYRFLPSQLRPLLLTPTETQAGGD